MAGGSGRVTQDPIFTCMKVLSTDNVSQEAELTFIKLMICWTQGEKFSTKNIKKYDSVSSNVYQVPGKGQNTQL